MKHTLRQYTPVAVLLALILVVSTVLSLLISGGREQDSRPTVLTTGYPLYVAAQSILGNTDEVRLQMLSGSGAGCLHDYQLTPADRLALAQAEVVLTNGGGEWAFLDEVVDPARVVDTSEGLDKLSAADFYHTEEHDHHGHDHEKEYFNEHFWVSPARYQKQVLAVMDTIIGLDSGNESIYRENAANYLMNVDYLWSEMTSVSLTDRPCVLFHDSLVYLATDLGLEVELVLTFDSDSGISPSDLAEVERLAQEHPDLLLIYDTQYPIRYAAVDGLVPASQVLALDTAVVGEGKSTDWIKAMEYNVTQLKQLTEGGDAP